MAINKRFTQLNNSGSNHSILDAESAYITGTLQVGPAVPVLGSDVNFFVSGAKDGEGGATPGVGVFGGDLVVSGNLHFLGGITGSIPGVEAYWTSPVLGVIKAETSSSMVEVPYLSASNGAEITGSLVVSASSAIMTFNGTTPNTLRLYNEELVFQEGVELSTGSLKYDGNNPLVFELYSGRDLNINALYTIFVSAALGGMYVGANTVFNAGLSGSLQTLADGITAYITGGPYITVTTNSLGQIEITGSAGGGSSPEYWFSTGSNEAYTTGSVLIRAGLAASPTPSIVEFDVSGSEITTKNGSYRGSAVRVKDVAVAASDWDFTSGSLYVMAANVGASGSGGYVNIEAGNAGWDDVNPQAGGWVSLLAGNGANTLQSYNGGFISIEAGSPGWSGGAFNAGEEGKAGDVEILGGAISPVSRSLSGSNFLMASFRSFKINDDLNNLDSSTDVFFFASGSIGAKGTSDRGVAVFGGDLHVSGGLTVDNPAIFATGLTGSLTEVSAGVPYLLAGDNIILVTNSLGQVAISASNLYWTSDVANNIYTTGSAVVSSSLFVNPAGTGRGLLKFGGLDIGPITGSMTVTSAEQSGAVLSGSLLSASNGVAAESVLRHEFHILGFGIDGSSNSNIFAATYLVMSYVNTGGVQTAIAVTEISREASGSYATGSWDVNVSSDCNIEVTGGVGGNVVRWYGQRIKEMSLNSAGGIT